MEQVISAEKDFFIPRRASTYGFLISSFCVLLEGSVFPMRRISLKLMTDKQRQVWMLRFRKRWRLKQIAINMGMSESGVSKMLQRAQSRAGLPKCRISVIDAKPRKVRAHQLSYIFE